MPKGQLLDIGNTGKSATAIAENLFSEKSRWVHLWIYKRGMPFVALVALYVARYNATMPADILTGPSWFYLLLAFIVFCVALVRIVPARHSLAQLRGSYVFSFGYIALGIYISWLIAGFNLDGSFTNIQNTPLAIHNWLYFYAGFWALTWLKCKDIVTSEEYFALAGYIAVSYGLGPESSSIWINVSVLFVPSIYLLYRQQESFRTILFLSAIVTYFLIVSEITGYFYVLIAFIGCLGFIWVVVKALKKLSDENVSNLLYSFCLLIISGLIFFVISVLFQFDPERPLTWWGMYSCFAVLCLLIWRSCGKKIAPIIALWQSYWLSATLFVTLIDFVDVLSERTMHLGTLAIILCSAIALRELSARLNSNRLYVWSRIYMMLAAGTAIFETGLQGEFSILWLLAVVVCFAVAVWLAQVRHLAKGLAWWRGVINPRTIVALRRIGRKSRSWIVSIPFLGSTIAASLRAGMLLMHLKKGGRRIDSADLLLILWSVSLSLVVALSLEQEFGPNLYTDLLLSESEFYVVSVAMFSGILLSVIGRFYEEPMFPLLGMMAFIASPAYLFQLEGELSISFWLAVITSASCIVFAKDVVEIK